jgi:rhamnose transport system permease protein
MTEVAFTAPATSATRTYLTHALPWWRRTLLTHEAMIILSVVVVSMIAAASIPRFATPLTLSYLLLDVTPILLCALPVTLILVSGEIDLSIASAVGFSNVVIGWLFAEGVPIQWAILAGALSGLLVGVVNGFLVAVLQLPSLAVTIGTLALFRGISIGILGTDSITSFPVELKALANANVPSTGFPLVMFAVLAAIVLFAVMLHFTPFGRSVYATGQGIDTARFSGVRTVRVKFTLFLLSGLLAGLVGVYYTFRYGSARGDNAAGLELAVIAGVVLGGVSIFGGRGRIVGVVGGVLLIGLVQSVLRFMNYSSDVINIAVGGLLVVSVAVPLAFTAITQTVARARRTASTPMQAEESQHRKGKE